MVPGEKLNGEGGGRYRIRTCDFHRVKFEVVNLKPFACLAFPLSQLPENALKRPSFGYELVTSFRARNNDYLKSLLVGSDMPFAAMRQFGGAPSQVRTILPAQFPANGEKYREFSRFRP
jgi:hypothetical protein